MVASAGAAQLVALEERQVVVGDLEKIPAREPSPAIGTGPQLGHRELGPCGYIPHVLQVPLAALLRVTAGWTVIGHEAIPPWSGPGSVTSTRRAISVRVPIPPCIVAQCNLIR